MHDAPKLTDTLTIRLSPILRKLLNRRAALLDRKPSDTARQILVEALQPEKETK